MTFHPADPLIMLYGPIEKLRKLAIAACISYTSEQVLDVGLTVIKNTRDFEHVLMDWQAKPLIDKNWAAFKLYFTTAQKLLKDIRSPTMQQADYHHENMMATQLQDNIIARNDEVVTMLQQVLASQALPPNVHADNASEYVQ